MKIVSAVDTSPWAGSTRRTGSLPGGRTGGFWTTTGAPGLPVDAASPPSWTGHHRQEILLHLQLADLLVQAGDQGRGALGLVS